MVLSLLVAVALAAPQKPAAYTMQAVGVGEQAPDSSVLMKITELADDALRRTGVPEAGVGPDPGQAWVEKARLAYYDLKFADALQSAQAAIDHYEKFPTDLGDGQRYLAAQTYAAMAELERGHEKLAQEHFAAALTVRPDLHLLESDFSPTSIAALERARDQHITDRPRSTLTVTTSPAFAKVRLDGTAVGEAPMTLKGVLVGRHFVSAAREGHVPQAEWVAVAEGRGGKVSFVLPESPVETSRRAVAGRVAAGADAALEVEARALAASAKAGAALVIAVGRSGARWVVVMAWVPVEGKVVRAFSTVAQDLVDAPSTLDALVSAVQEPAAEGSPVKVGQPPLPGTLDFQKAWLGLKPPPPKLVALLPAPLPPVPVYKRPWVWVVAASAAVVLAGAGTAAYVATRPGPLPPGVQVHLELPF